MFMSNGKVEGIMGITMEKIKEMVDVNTVIGDPITVADGTVIIPVSKVTYGFASGGSDFPNKKAEKENLFGGGSGAGITITPIAFISISNGDAKLLQVEPFNNSTDRIIGMLPALIDKVAKTFKKGETKKEVKFSSEEEEI